MRHRGIARKWGRVLPVLAFVVFSSLIFSGCDMFDGPQNTFAPKGDVAQLQKRDFLLVMWPALVIMIGVLAACVVIPLMYLRKKGEDTSFMDANRVLVVDEDKVFRRQVASICEKRGWDCRSATSGAK